MATQLKANAAITSSADTDTADYDAFDSLGVYGKLTSFNQTVGAILK